MTKPPSRRGWKGVHKPDGQTGVPEPWWTGVGSWECSLGLTTWRRGAGDTSCRSGRKVGLVRRGMRRGCRNEKPGKFRLGGGSRRS